MTTTRGRTETTSGRRIVVGVDGSKGSELALRWGAHLARSSGASLTALIAWEHLMDWAPVVTASDPSPTAWHPGLHAGEVLHQTVHRALTAEQAAAVDYRTVEGGPAKMLIDASEDATMIVLGSRGRGGFRGLRLGSVSHAVTAHSACPVLIVHGDREPPA